MVLQKLAVSLKMKFCVLISFIIISDLIPTVTGNGAMYDPPGRNVMWKYRFPVEKNYNYMQLHCGGILQEEFGEKKCGVCGDPPTGPKDHEVGGKYGSRIISRYYPEGTKEMVVRVELTTYEKGFFEFRICKADKAPVTQKCLDNNLLIIEEGISVGNPTRFYPNTSGDFHLTVKLPTKLTCQRCVLQWRYRTAVTWGSDPATGKEGMGIGPQQEIYNCADIRIGGPIPNILAQNIHFSPLDHNDNSTVVENPTDRRKTIAKEKAELKSTAEARKMDSLPSQESLITERKVTHDAVIPEHTHHGVTTETAGPSYSHDEVHKHHAGIHTDHSNVHAKSRKEGIQINNARGPAEASYQGIKTNEANTGVSVDIHKHGSHATVKKFHSLKSGTKRVDTGAVDRLRAVKTIGADTYVTAPKDSGIVHAIGIDMETLLQKISPKYTRKPVSNSAARRTDNRNFGVVNEASQNTDIATAGSTVGNKVPKSFDPFVKRETKHHRERPSAEVSAGFSNEIRSIKTPHQHDNHEHHRGAHFAHNIVDSTAIRAALRDALQQSKNDNTSEFQKPDMKVTSKKAKFNIEHGNNKKTVNEIDLTKAKAETKQPDVTFVMVNAGRHTVPPLKGLAQSLDQVHQLETPSPDSVRLSDNQQSSEQVSSEDLKSALAAEILAAGAGVPVSLESLNLQPAAETVSRNTREQIQGNHHPMVPFSTQPGVENLIADTRMEPSGLPVNLRQVVSLVRDNTETMPRKDAPVIGYSDPFTYSTGITDTMSVDSDNFAVRRDNRKRIGGKTHKSTERIMLDSVLRGSSALKADTNLGGDQRAHRRENAVVSRDSGMSGSNVISEGKTQSHAAGERAVNGSIVIIPTCISLFILPQDGTAKELGHKVMLDENTLSTIQQQLGGLRINPVFSKVSVDTHIDKSIERQKDFRHGLSEKRIPLDRIRALNYESKHHTKLQPDPNAAEINNMPRSLYSSIDQNIILAGVPDFSQIDLKALSSQDVTQQGYQTDRKTDTESLITTHDKSKNVQDNKSASLHPVSEKSTVPGQYKVEAAEPGVEKSVQNIIQLNNTDIPLYVSEDNKTANNDSDLVYHPTNSGPLHEDKIKEKAHHNKSKKTEKTVQQITTKNITLPSGHNVIETKTRTVEVKVTETTNITAEKTGAKKPDATDETKDTEITSLNANEAAVSNQTSANEKSVDTKTNTEKTETSKDPSADPGQLLKVIDQTLKKISPDRNDSPVADKGARGFDSVVEKALNDIMHEPKADKAVSNNNLQSTKIADQQDPLSLIDSIKTEGMASKDQNATDSSVLSSAIKNGLAQLEKVTKDEQTTTDKKSGINITSKKAKFNIKHGNEKKTVKEIDMTKAKPEKTHPDVAFIIVGDGQGSLPNIQDVAPSVDELKQLGVSASGSTLPNGSDGLDGVTDLKNILSNEVSGPGSIGILQPNNSRFSTNLHPLKHIDMNNDRTTDKVVWKPRRSSETDITNTHRTLKTSPQRGEDQFLPTYLHADNAPLSSSETSALIGRKMGNPDVSGTNLPTHSSAVSKGLRIVPHRADISSGIGTSGIGSPIGQHQRSQRHPIAGTVSIMQNGHHIGGGIQEPNKMIKVQSRPLINGRTIQGFNGHNENNQNLGTQRGTKGVSNEPDARGKYRVSSGNDPDISTVRVFDLRESISQERNIGTREQTLHNSRHDPGFERTPGPRLHILKPGGSANTLFSNGVDSNVPPSVVQGRLRTGAIVNSRNPQTHLEVGGERSIFRRQPAVKAPTMIVSGVNSRTNDRGRRVFGGRNPAIWGQASRARTRSDTSSLRSGISLDSRRSIAANHFRT